MRGVFEALVTEMRHHQGLNSPKHLLKCFPKKNLGFDRPGSPGPSRSPALRWTGLWHRVVSQAAKELHKERDVSCSSEACHCPSRVLWLFQGDMRCRPNVNRRAATWQQCPHSERQRVACFREHLSQSHVQVRRHHRYILPRINIGTISKLAFVATHNVIALLSAPPQQ